jgi:site-specific DNA recombinase
MSENVIAYYRVSTEHQAKVRDTIPLQRRACQEYAAKAGLNVLQEYMEDEGISGTDDRRPAYLEALQRLQDPSVAGLLVYDIDRWSRSKRTAVLSMLDLARDGKHLHLARTGKSFLWEQSMEQLFAIMQAYMAGDELEHIRDRLMMGRERVKREKGWNYWKKKPVDMKRVRELKALGVPVTVIAEGQ